MSWTEEQYQLIKFQDLHRYDPNANPGRVGLGQCRCGEDMYWCDYYPHFADELLKLGWNAPGGQKDYPETHKTGHVMVHNADEIAVEVASGDVDFGVQIANDGRVWVCVNGTAYLRFKPTREASE